MGKFSNLKNLLVTPAPEELTSSNGNLEEALSKADSPKQFAPLSILHPSRFQAYPPSREDVEKLKPSIAAIGILEDLLVRPHPEISGEFEILAGHTRRQAAIEAGQQEAPIKIFDVPDEVAIDIVTTTNLQRRQLNPIAETDAILKLLSVKLKKPQTEIIQLFYQLGNNKKNVLLTPEWSTIEAVFMASTRISPDTFRVERLPLLNLPEEILEALRSGRLEYTKARAIARVKDEQFRQELLEAAIAEGLSLKQIKERINANALPPEPKSGIKTEIAETLKLAKQAASLPLAKQRQLSNYLQKIRDLLAE